MWKEIFLTLPVSVPYINGHSPDYKIKTLSFKVSPTVDDYTWLLLPTDVMQNGRWGLMKFRGISAVNNQGAVSIRKTVLPGMAIPMLKIRRPNGRLIFNMEIAIRR